MRRFLSGSLFTMVGLFLVDASYPLSFSIHHLVRSLLVVSVVTVIFLVALMLVRRQQITLTAPLPRLRVSFKEKIAQLRLKKNTEHEVHAAKERVAYQHQRIIKKLGKAHDISFHTTQHVKVQQNLGFLKKN